MNEILPHIPRMLSGTELVKALAVYPEYSDDIRAEDEATRLLALDDIYRIYHPSMMSVEIYNKIYTSLAHALRQRDTQQYYHGIAGGADSFSVLANSGLGKSTAVARAISLINTQPFLTFENPYRLFVPIIVVPCPFNCSLKSLTLLILQTIDDIIGTSYVSDALRERLNSDMLIARLAKIVRLHIGLIVVEEIENLTNNHNARSLVGFLTQLINSGVSIAFIGTHQAKPFIDDYMLARRMQALSYSPFPLDDYFRTLCQVVFAYQYVRRKTEITEGIINWLYQHTQGVVAVLISLIHDAQEIAIADGREVLNIDTLNDAYRMRMSLLHPFIAPKEKHFAEAPKEKAPTESILSDTVISDGIRTAKESGVDIISYLAELVTVEEICVSGVCF